jgi:hypothetical protein
MYYTQNSSVTTPTPTANIAVNRNRLKHYSGDTVYLKDNTHFEIELYNPKQLKVLAKIQINGQTVSGNGIILRPGERVFLERWIDTPQKFLFETYQVEDSNESRNAIAKNGKVTVEFYDETIFLTNGTFSTSTVLLTDSPTWTNRSGFDPLNDGNFVYGGSTVNYCSMTSIGANASVAGSLETGRVEKGESSNQILVTDSAAFNYVCNSRVELRILPESQKPVEVKEIRNYCTECGTRMKAKSWKFCPSCGTKI